MKMSAALLAVLAGAAMALAQPSKPMTTATEKTAAQPASQQPQASKPAGSAGLWVPADQIAYTLEDVVTDVVVPWEIVFDPSGRMLFTERPGRVRVYKDGKLEEKPYFTVPNVWVRSESGLMGMCLHPDYAKNKYVYLSFSYGDADKKPVDNRVVRYKDTGTTLEEDKVILTGFPLSGNHSGCQIHFGPDGKLYISTGEMFKQNLAQDMNSLGGKMLRVNDDGSIPTDNPFVGTEGARGEIWALGLRNPQGFDWQPGTNKIFESEHGPSGERGIGDNNSDGDEFNMVEKGKNLGWPIIHHKMEKEGYVTPLIDWSKPGMAPGGGCFVTSNAIPALKGCYLVACLKGEQLRRITLEGDKVVHDEPFLKKLGRIRAVTQGPDGCIYFSTSNKDGRGQHGKPNDDRIIRIKPGS